jgi:hypothetical protein
LKAQSVSYVDPPIWLAANGTIASETVEDVEVHSASEVPLQNGH